jgi:hypothetical protein
MGQITKAFAESIVSNDCRTCRFWKPRFQRVEYADHDDGECRKNAPGTKRVESWHDLREFLPVWASHKGCGLVRGIRISFRLIGGLNGF